MSHIWPALIGMAVITFSCRYAFFAHSFELKLPEPIEKALKYAAPAVLTAMWVPIVFMQENRTLTTDLTDPFLVAGVLTLLLALFIKRTLLVVFLGMAAFLLLKLYQ
ncbi:hypothetical protein EOPP23_06920 [Endozoicomonas sp. OPT23]|uniref:AzlD domain-containing protein n=1 Tax=Endozoicomonas sp. OPT23 TaxID=2072845 RepID=UPI00129A1CAF|nr:AzlD domain-containing protein [Endozoicomonas sp. OPT23]MRI32718.1 hypothetical protein [Endozoicomonas sp. OPT23]